MISTILEYLEERFSAGRRADYDPQLIAALIGDVPVGQVPAAIERALTAIEAVQRRSRRVDPWLVNEGV